jgi:hypothetical protein
MIVAFSMDAFSAVTGHATSPAWHTSMPSGGGIHSIKTQSVGLLPTQKDARVHDWMAASDTEAINYL